MYTSVPHAVLWYPGLPVAAGILCSLVLVWLWHHTAETCWLIWAAACAAQTVALMVGFAGESLSGGPWLTSYLLVQAAALLFLAKAALQTASWMDRQKQQVRLLLGDIDRLRSGGTPDADRDHLTGLLNQSALSKCIEGWDEFHGVAAVCDIDNFKELNDRFGHLAGDEMLHNIGQLLRSSIRQQDEAFRWGGDEFVVLFDSQDGEVARQRMQQVEQHLRSFQVRGVGLVPLSFSWGIAEGQGRPLRVVLDMADHEMYAFKRRNTGHETDEAAGDPGGAGG